MKKIIVGILIGSIGLAGIRCSNTADEGTSKVVEVISDDQTLRPALDVLLKEETDEDILKYVEELKKAIPLPVAFDEANISDEIGDSILSSLSAMEQSYKNNTELSQEEEAILEKLLNTSSLDDNITYEESFLLDQFQYNYDVGFTTIQDGYSNNNITQAYEGRVAFFLTREIILDAMDPHRNKYMDVSND
ncbi:hypothetical protein Amet_1805 [Alkaliphilus metalliredigens QYMF]|uniref:Uncharacterized protein n=1 Tax=Alkaliphilus metalliredigens (strain QYMF) TaxID=293826 RepID=A6TP57_ALKMQ|nr:hypothetical protein [Alkaliphilus metalliredigens]ABR47975.1 hypothetical protein Amet_1805 [Alkaliphilus metalliredigens QYMF]